MHDDYVIPMRRLTEEDVLAMLNEDYRHREHLDWGNRNSPPLTFETTVEQYEETFDYPPTLPALRRSFNEFFGLKIDRELCDVMHPPRKRTLGDVCRYIVSKNAQAPVLRPVPVLGQDCATAGAFVTIRTLLRDAGADVSQIAPSTPLAPYTRRHIRPFIDLGLMAPGRLPLITVRWGWLGCAAVVIVACFAAAVVNLSVRSPELGDWAAGVAIAAIGLALFFRKRRPSEVRLGELKTFRDLCVAVSAV